MSGIEAHASIEYTPIYVPCVAGILFYTVDPKYYGKGSGKCSGKCSGKGNGMGSSEQQTGSKGNENSGGN